MTYKKLLNWKTALATAALLIIGGVVLFANSSALAASNDTYIWRSLTWVNSTSFKATLNDNGTIKTLTFTGGGGSNSTGVYTASSYKGCQEKFRVTYNSSAASWEAAVVQPDCAHSSFNTIGTTQGAIGGVPKAPKPPGNGGGSGCTPNSKVPACTPTGGGKTPKPAPVTKAITPTLACDTSIFNPLTWFICPLVAAAQSAINGLQTGIDSLLTINTCSLFSTNSSCTNSNGKPISNSKVSSGQKQTSGGFYQAWNTFRLFAVGIIIIAGLVMIISQAAGMEVFDAYTIRKVLPRLLIAIIFISLSWPVLQFLITLSNDAGEGVRQIIYQPFLSIGGKDGVVTINGGTSSVAALVGTTALFSLGLLGLASFILTALLAVIVGFVILLLRQMVVIMLVIVAPLAIACYVMPNTQKAWNFWKDTFISMLVAFPIISGFIAMGRVFAVVMYNGDLGVPDIIQQLGALIAFFLPYFMLPFAFRMAGGAVANLAGIVNDKGRGGFDRLKGFRQKRAASIWQDRSQRAKSGNIVRGKGKVSGAINSSVWGVANVGEAGYNPAKWRTKMGIARGSGDADEASRLMQESSVIHANQQDSKVMAAAWALADGQSTQQVRQMLQQSDPDRFSDEGQLNDAMTRAQLVQREGSNEAVKKASVIAQMGTQDGMATDENGTTQEKLAHAIAESSNSDSDALRLWAQARSAASGAGRVGVSGGGFMSSGGKQVLNARHGGNVDSDEWLQDVALNQDAVSLLRGNPQDTADVMGAVQRGLTNLAANQNSGEPAQRDANMAKFSQLAQSMESAQSSRMYASPRAINIVTEAASNVPPEVNNRGRGSGSPGAGGGA